MNNRIVPLSSVRKTDIAQVGGKAAALGELLAAGFPMPPGLCVTTAVFHEALAPYKNEINRLCQQIDGLVPKTAVTASGKILAILQNITIPKLVTAELGGYLETEDWRLETHIFQSPISKSEATPTPLLAIRSSATAEDQEEVSFAGQYATLLGVHGQQAVAEAILTCWLSFFTPQALMARAYADAIGPDEGMAVLIQPMIEAECAGVCFTVDPIQERDDIIMVNAVWGLGEGVVDGSMPTDSHWVRRRDLSLEWQRIVEKDEMIGLETGEWQGEAKPSHLHQSPVSSLPVPAERQRAACLPKAWLQRVAAFGLAVEQVTGLPQDIEWAIANGRFWLLQSRPLTALPEAIALVPHFPVVWQVEAESRFYWRLTEHCEGPEPPLPLEHDFIELRESIREETCRYMGADRHEAWRMWNGRSYRRHIPLSLTEADMALRRQAVADLHDRLQASGWTSWDYWGPEIEQMTERLREQWRNLDWNTATGPILADHLAQAQAVERYCMAIHPRILFRPRQQYFEAFAAVSGLSGAAAETAAYQLLDGEESKLTQLIDSLYELAQVAKGESAVAQLITILPDDIMAQLKILPAAAEFRAKFTDLLAEYGERIGHGYGSEMTVLTPTWYEEPERALDLVRGYLTVAEAPAFVRARLRQTRDEQVADLYAASEDETATATSPAQTIAEFQRQLAYARRSMVGLEDHNHQIEQVAGGQLRLAIIAAGQGLVKQNRIADVDDVFWLTFAEIEAALRNDPPSPLRERASAALSLTGAESEWGSAQLQKIIAERQEVWQQWATMEPPPILGIPEAILPARPPFADEVNVEEDGEGNGRLVGLGASPGVAEGQACIMRKGYLLPELEPGTILVAPNAGPLWTPYFPQLAGLVLEEGSLGQHAAAAAREYGIPTVINCKRATQLIQDEAWLRLDGAQGTVEFGQ